MFKVPRWEDGTPKVNLSFPKKVKTNNKRNKKLLESPKIKEVITQKLKAKKNLNPHFKLVNKKQNALNNNDPKSNEDVIINGGNKIISNVKNKNHTPKRPRVAKKQEIIVEANNSMESVKDNKNDDKLYDTDKLDELILNEKKQKLNSYKKDDVEEILFNDNSENIKIKIPKVENIKSDPIDETKEEKKKRLKSILQKRNRNNSETKNLHQVENLISKPKNKKKNKVQNSILLQNGNKDNLENEKTMEERPLQNQIVKNKEERKKKIQKSLLLQNGNKNNLENEKTTEEHLLENQIVNKDERKKKIKKSTIQNANKINSENKINKEIKHISVVNKIIKAKDEKKKEAFKTILSHRNSIKISGNKLRERMLERLKAAQFRYLNEKLYTSSGSDAKQLFQEDPEAFQTYHEGYQQQVKRWPVKPLEVIVKRIKKMPKTHTIADMGCGEAELSTCVVQPVRSFDLVASKPSVETCDMAHTPLLSSSMDVAVYCLALMGTDLTQYLIEANRVLKVGGHLLIAEVESRFHDVDSFTQDVQKLGFSLKKIDKSQKVFFFMEFTKVRDPPVKKAKLPVLSLKPCIYKKR